MKNISSDQINQRIDLAKNVDGDEWKRIVLDFFLGKLSQLGEAALVFWLDDRYAAGCEDEYLKQSIGLISKLDPIFYKLRNLAAADGRNDSRAKRYLELRQGLEKLRK